ARVWCPELWVSTEPGVQGCTAPGGRTAASRIYHGGRRGPEKLFRHDILGPVDEAGGGKSVGRRGDRSAEGNAEPEGDGNGDELDAGGGYTPRSGNQSASVQHLPRPAGPEDGPSRGGDGAVCR